MRRAVASFAAAIFAIGMLAGCGSSSDTGAFCAASASLTVSGTQIQRLSPDDLTQVKAQVAALVPQAKHAEATAPKAIHDEVKLLVDALTQFASSVAVATDPQAVITGFAAYDQRARDLAAQAERVDNWVSGHCPLSQAPAT